jgi:hypothetical protein
MGRGACYDGRLKILQGQELSQFALPARLTLAENYGALATALSPFKQSRADPLLIYRPQLEHTRLPISCKALARSRPLAGAAASYLLSPYPLSGRWWRLPAAGQTAAARLREGFSRLSQKPRRYTGRGGGR